jgi:quinol monooxygenase YgiN
MICVIATIEINDGRRAAFLDVFTQLVPKVRAENGCIEYGPMIDVPTNIPVQPPERTNAVTIVEKWESVEALETHLIAPHMLEYKKAVKDIVKGMSIQVLEPAEQAVG